MTVDDSAQSLTVWPLPGFRFQVGWASEVMAFQEVSGLAADIDASNVSVGLRHLDWDMTGLGEARSSSLVLKRGLFTSDTNFWDWFSEMKMNTASPPPMRLTLLDEASTPLMVWTVANAWPVEITGADLDSGGNEVAIETLKVSYSGISVGSG